MKISTDKLKLFSNEDELKRYLKVNGITGAAVTETIADWKASKKEKPRKKVTMVATETDTTVETK